MTVPFAVRETPQVRPDLWPLTRRPPAHVEDDGPRTLVRLDVEVPALVAAARHQVVTDADPWTSASDDLDRDGAVAAGRALAHAVSAAVPSLLAVEGERVTLPGAGVTVGADGDLGRGCERHTVPVPGGGDTVVARLVEVPPEHRHLEAVALAIAEDVVVVDASGRVLWAHVCAPSGWDPGVAAGRWLAELHGPVPAAERLRAASTALARAIVTAGPHVRWVWGLTDDPAAAHHPRFRGPATTARGEVAALTFRAERQTTLPVPGHGLGVFLIRVHRAPLGAVAATPQRRTRLAAAIRSLPDDLAVYKGVTARRDDLLAWATAGRGGSAPQ